MIIEIMLIILAMISVVVNTIVSVIIIKDTLNNRKWQDRIDKEIDKRTDKELDDLCERGGNFEAFRLKAIRQPNQEQNQSITTSNLEISNTTA